MPDQPGRVQTPEQPEHEHDWVDSPGQRHCYVCFVDEPTSNVCQADAFGPCSCGGCVL